ncbi:MAG: peptide deformylase [Propionibacteriaceae bacterium]|jgi:peptide deformylase|nr:peptide deformylase [Propionibacteriaceae bacterium]
MSIQEFMTGGKLLPITRWGEPVMHQQTEPITVFDDELRELARDMFATMEAAQGVGLAATQVGKGISLFVFTCPDADDNIVSGAFCNPVVILPEGNARNLQSQDEGCLSLPGGYAPLARPDHAVCTGQDLYGQPYTVTGTGLLARCLQHETDHLNGIVFGDRLSNRVRKHLYQEHDAVADLYPSDWPVSPKLDHAQ